MVYSFSSLSVNSIVSRTVFIVFVSARFKQPLVDVDKERWLSFADSTFVRLDPVKVCHLG